jgi:phosphogluconate dehydratase
MPELHKLTPLLGTLQDKGFKVALLTDGRMSGASGKIPAAIHLSPDSAAGGPIVRVREGDLIELDCDQGILKVDVDEEEWQRRDAWVPVPRESADSLGRSLFALFREHAAPTEAGGSAILS